MRTDLAGWGPTAGSRISAGAAWSSFESVTTDLTGGKLLPGQAEKSPTKPARVASVGINQFVITRGSFRLMA
jgi:hypothetical protein